MWRQNMRVRNKVRVGYESLRDSINVLEPVGMVWIAYVMIVIRKDFHRQEGEEVLMRGDNASAVQ